MSLKLVIEREVESEEEYEFLKRNSKLSTETWKLIKENGSKKEVKKLDLAENLEEKINE